MIAPPSGAVPALRIAAANARPPRPGGDYVLYWMIAARRTRASFPLQRAVEWATELGRPLLVLEALRCDYPWASDRLHAFVIAGMADNAAAFAGHRVSYFPYVETERGGGKGLLQALAADACVVVTDEFPGFFLPRMVAAAAARLDVLVEQVDGNGLLPLRAVERVFPTAFSFRRLLHEELPRHLDRAPAEDPLSGTALPAQAAPRAEVLRRWPPADLGRLAAGAAPLAHLPIDHGVAVAPAAGGAAAGLRALRRFVAERLPHYAARRNDLDDEVTSGLSPYLHFGHVGVHQAFAAVADSERWRPPDLASSRIPSMIMVLDSALSMSYRVKAATEAAVSASISTPVADRVLASHSTRMRSAAGAKRTAMWSSARE